MEEIKETKPKKPLPQKISEAFLEGTLFLLFGSKKWQTGKKQIPPIYIVGGLILLLIFVSVIKKIHSKPKQFYPLPEYQYQTPQRDPFKQEPFPRPPDPFPLRRNH